MHTYTSLDAPVSSSTSLYSPYCGDPRPSFKCAAFRALGSDGCRGFHLPELEGLGFTSWGCGAQEIGIMENQADVMDTGKMCACVLRATRLQ